MQGFLEVMSKLNMNATKKTKGKRRKGAKHLERINGGFSLVKAMWQHRKVCLWCVCMRCSGGPMVQEDFCLHPERPTIRGVFIHVHAEGWCVHHQGNGLGVDGYKSLNRLCLMDNHTQALGCEHLSQLGQQEGSCVVVVFMPWLHASLSFSSVRVRSVAYTTQVMSYVRWHKQAREGEEMCDIWTQKPTQFIARTSCRWENTVHKQIDTVTLWQSEQNHLFSEGHPKWHLDWAGPICMHCRGLSVTPFFRGTQPTPRNGIVP